MILYLNKGSFFFFIYINEKEANYSTKKIFDFKINKKRKFFIIRFKDYLIYKIKYIDYNNDDDLFI